LSSKAKIKGTRVENEIVKLFIKEGFNAKRQPLSGALIDFPHDVQVHDLFGGTNIEVKARKSGEGFAQLDKWKGSADLLILKKDFSTPMVYVDWNLFKEFLHEYRENRSTSESGEQTDICHFNGRKKEVKNYSKKSTSKIPSVKFSDRQGSRQNDRKSWPINTREIAKRSFRQKSDLNGGAKLQTRWEYIKEVSKK
jgi:Holliday junction resolvase